MIGLGVYNPRVTEIFDSLNTEARVQLRWMLEFGFTIEDATALFREGLEEEKQSCSMLDPSTSVRITPLAHGDLECLGWEDRRPQLEEALRSLKPPFAGERFVRLPDVGGWLLRDGPYRVVFRWDESAHTAVVFAVAPAGIKPTAKVWRYFNQAKAEDLCASGELYFCRLDHLGDPLEGRLPAATMSARISAFKTVFGTSATPAAALAEEVFRASSFVTCWTLQDHESWFGWKNYCTDVAGQPDGGFAIVTTWRRLEHFAAHLRQQNPHLFLRFVGYLDPACDGLPNGAEGEQAFYKAFWFSAERELRFALLREGSGEMADVLRRLRAERSTGERIPCDLNRLTVEIVLNPWASAEQKQELRSLIATKHPTLISRVSESSIRTAQRQ